MSAVALVIPMTDGRSRMVHLIEDADAAAGRATGRYVAVCGDIVVAGALATPDGEGCRFCRVWAAHRGVR